MEMFHSINRSFLPSRVRLFDGRIFLDVQRAGQIIPRLHQTFSMSKSVRVKCGEDWGNDWRKFESEREDVPNDVFVSHQLFNVSKERSIGLIDQNKGKRKKKKVDDLTQRLSADCFILDLREKKVLKRKEIAEACPICPLILLDLLIRMSFTNVSSPFRRRRLDDDQ